MGGYPVCSNGCDGLSKRMTQLANRLRYVIEYSYTGVLGT